MENTEIDIAKKYFGKHFLNQFKLVNNWSELPKEFRRIIGSQNIFQLYSERGDFLFIKGPENNYLAHITPKEITIINSQDQAVSEFDLGDELNLNILGLSIENVLNYLKNKQQSKIVKLSESELIGLIKKVISKI